jgi:hypothetical protein
MWLYKILADDSIIKNHIKLKKKFPFRLILTRLFTQDFQMKILLPFF